MRTEIELVDRGRDDVPSGWEHEAIRRAFRFENVQANSAKFRAVCGTTEDAASEGRQWTLDPALGECTLYFYGAPGTKFDLVEY